MLSKRDQHVPVDDEEFGGDLQRLLQETEKLKQISQLMQGLSGSALQDAETYISEKELFADALAVIASDFDAKQTDKVRLVPADRSLKVRCKRTKMAQALADLIENALEATKGQSRPWVEVLFIEKDDTVELAVSDSGPPLNNTVISHMFEAFFTTKRGEGKLGLGLSRAKKFVEDCQGDLKYQPSSGRTSFSISIPAATEPS